MSLRDCKVITITWSQARFVREDEGVKVYDYPKMEELLNDFLSQGYEVKQILQGGNLCYLEVYLERVYQTYSGLSDSNDYVLHTEA